MAISDEETSSLDIATYVGAILPRTNTKEATELMGLIMYIYRTHHGVDLTTDAQLGETWKSLCTYSISNPDEEISKTFNELNAAWKNSEKQ